MHSVLDARPHKHRGPATRTVLAVMAVVASIAMSVAVVAGPAWADQECLADAADDLRDRVTGDTAANPRGDLLSICADHSPGQLELSARFGEATDIATYEAWTPGQSALVFEIRTNPLDDEGPDTERDYDVIVGRSGQLAAYAVRSAADGTLFCQGQLPDDGLPTDANPRLAFTISTIDCIPDSDQAPISVGVAAYLFFNEENSNATVDEVPTSTVGYSRPLGTTPTLAVNEGPVLRIQGRNSADDDLGDGRSGTALRISRARFPEAGSANSAVLVTGQSAPDALTAAPLAVHHNGPLLLLDRRASLGDPVTAEIQRVLPAGGTVYVVGGTSVIDDAVIGEITDLGYAAARLGGQTRHETALAVANAISPDPTRVVLADSTSYHLPLLGATYAAASNQLRVTDEGTRAGTSVLLLTGGGDEAQAALLDYLGPDRPGREYVVVGSIAAGFADANALPVDDDNRLVAAGDDPFATAHVVARRFDGDNAVTVPQEESAPQQEAPADGAGTYAQDGQTPPEGDADAGGETPADAQPQPEGPPPALRGIGTLDPPEFITVVSGVNFADAVSGSTLAATYGSPLLFAYPDTLLPSTRLTLNDEPFNGVHTGFVVGGVSALFNSVAAQVSACAAATGEANC